MTEQDLRAPEDRVKVSKREAFRRTYDLFQDEDTPENLVGYTFAADLINRAGTKLVGLSEASGIARPKPNTVTVVLNTIQMSELVPGEYRLRLYGTREGEREEFVIIVMQVEV